ncbi:MAG: hypothetical protein ACYTG0_46440, partial [Planctomycetota bacterium]
PPPTTTPGATPKSRARNSFYNGSLGFRGVEEQSRPTLGATAALSSSVLPDTMFTISNVQPHRKLVRHYDDPGHFHELTFSCASRKMMPCRPSTVCRLKY